MPLHAVLQGKVKNSAECEGRGFLERQDARLDGEPRAVSAKQVAAKGSGATERSVSGYLAKGKRKAPRGCRLAVYLPTDTLMRGSRQEHRGINRLRMYQIRITSLKSLSP